MTGGVVRIVHTFPAMSADAGELVGKTFTVWSRVGEREAVPATMCRASVCVTTLVSAFADGAKIPPTSSRNAAVVRARSFRTAAEAFG